MDLFWLPALSPIDGASDARAPALLKSGAALAEDEPSAHKHARMYRVLVTLTMIVFPVCSIVSDHAMHPGTPLMALVAKWYVFWAAGIRLFFAGLMQEFRPDFTARRIFNLSTDEAFPLIRELGIANLATGVLGIASIATTAFVLPVAIWAAIFYGAAGLGHTLARNRSANEAFAMITDLFAFVVFVVAVAGTLATR
jgi:hypothetical protein